MVVFNKEPVMSNNEDEMRDNEMESEVSEFESGSEDDEDVKLTEPSKNAIYNKDGLLDKLEDISWPKNVEWIHKLLIDIHREQEVDVNDDLAREVAFYTQALEGVRQAFQKLESMKLPFLRPVDYYAEMVKTDTHMEKVKGRLLAEKKNIEEAEERKKAREAKKMAKEVQSQKLKERAKQKKDDIESVKKWRKQRQQSGFAGGDKEADMGFSFEDGKSFERSSKRRPGVAPGDRSGGKARQGGKVQGGKGKKPMRRRESKDSKFGHGGRKGMKKQNTAETTNDFRGFKKSGVTGDKKRKR